MPDRCPRFRASEIGRVEWPARDGDSQHTSPVYYRECSFRRKRVLAGVELNRVIKVGSLPIQHPQTPDIGINPFIQGSEAGEDSGITCDNVSYPNPP